MLAMQACISENQRSVHVVGEAAALVLVAPFMVWIAARRELPVGARLLGLGIAAGTLIVDGGLLIRWWSARNAD